ncbi:SDR family oxidoreductase [Nocardia uniformis]|uniref:SDR family oxidoreductase n=1 Tax=Nocardia uniformis TaxID=53432 RepID=A0A849C4A4_9NOCA|nr:SDR family oxidoreductase [Nocardia uniformis]NNH73524.1 SDR family oxidoreductase [Nocardia uniformis]
MKSVLVTGAARGIGKAISLRLAETGWQVYAGVRKPADGDALVAQHPGIIPVLLDITDADQIAALDQTLPADLDAVVNNAGIVVDGPVEILSTESLRDQFEVNVIGTIAVTQAVLPRIRANKGRIVFLSSLSGRISTPGTGAYNSSKFALEGMVDALRIELRPWGIPVSMIEPGPIATDMWSDAVQMVDNTIARLTPAQSELYANHLAGMRKMAQQVQKIAAPVSTVVDEVERALTTRRPKARYVVGLSGKIQALSAGLTPTPILDAVLAMASGIKRR